MEGNTETSNLIQTVACFHILVEVDDHKTMRVYVDGKTSRMFKKILSWAKWNKMQLVVPLLLLVHCNILILTIQLGP